MIKVVVVDDSAFMRKAISTMLKKDPQIEVVAVARDGEEGLEMVRKYDPDVVTMDIEMPKMDGLTALKHIMMEMPRPVIMVSSLTTEGAEATLKAMEYGAVDFIPKQLSMVSLEIVKIEHELRAKVKSVAKRKNKLKVIRRVKKKVSDTTKKQKKIATPKGSLIRDIVAIGVSTGGPPVVQKVLSELPADFPACILIAQHMPKAFTGPFAKRLNESCKLKVKEAENGDVVKPGHVFVAPGGQHMKIDQKVSRIDVLVDSEPRHVLYKPSADVLIASVATGVGKRGLGVILTGMGNDGFLGIKELKKKGGKAIAQSEESCVVYGMPKAIVEGNLADAVVDVEEMPQTIISFLYE
ncbi:chemotaxis response regulator protein-glutamate methylesterase [Desulfohalobiaceae bacterium Ax17]|uniref:protein-glutamate methylesterase/protein-glutamine glutaminase n=1 Tax=Desulfovulcanus ferrireducens TaxID=2831190 RepID=UPI00207B9CD8|nr:chemotaxis response regulator protein-glutamate methylesterase [Desulfovulcanus ferrireducens]MBT8762668.1 chemotaxis response regulator protein-glutamate methylesterase [Desulfovulcanus ferrireducens]